MLGKEDLSHITDQLKTQLVQMPEMIPKMIEQVHFNKDKPENKNISLKRDNKVKVFIGNDGFLKIKKN